MAEIDSIDWARARWAELDGPDPERFAASAAVLRLSALVGANLDRALKEHDISRTAFLIMSTLRIAKDQSLTMSQLSRRLVLHPTTISLVVDQLQERGLAERSPHPTDKRTVLATLTDEGATALRAASETLSQSGYGLAGVDERGVIVLAEAVRHVRNALGDA